MTNEGIKTLLIVPDNITIYQLIKKYMNRRGLTNYDLRRDFLFLYNAAKIDPFSKEFIGKKFRDNMPIIKVEKTMLCIG